LGGKPLFKGDGASNLASKKWKKKRRKVKRILVKLHIGQREEASRRDLRVRSHEVWEKRPGNSGEEEFQKPS